MRRTSPAVRYDPRFLAVTVRRGASGEDVRVLFARAGTELERAIPQIRAYLVEVAPARRERALALLRRSPLVSSAGRELLADALDLAPNDTDWPQQWGLRIIGLPRAWPVTQGSSRVIVAVLDTGVDPNQIDLHGALVPGYDFVNSDSSPADDHGHGTAVAGIVAARANNRTGIAGVCWRCSIMPVKVLDGAGVGDDSLIAAGIVWAVDHGARVVNLSLGGPGVAQSLADAVAYAVGKGATVVAAAGNNGTSDAMYPAADRLAISVAGTTAADRRYPWSNFGSWVRVAAPGCNFATLRGGGGGIFCGTSSATPVVAGVVALAYSVNPAATPAEIEQALQRSAVPVPGTVQYGRISAPGTLTLVAARGPAKPARSVVAYRGRTGPRGRTYSLAVGAGQLTATLRFSRARVLSLSILPPTGTSRLAHAVGRSPLRLRTAVSAGTIRLSVMGPANAKFALTVSYARPGKATP